MKQPLILELKGNSLDDGPGIRSVVFVKGCPLSCAWCHNPESQRTSAELSFDARECVGCGTCIDTCPQGALSTNTPGLIDRSRCTSCFACAEACPSGALSRMGEDLSIDEIVRRCLRDKPYFDSSGGGVTISGGEPTMFPEFTGELLRRLKEEGIHTLVETCGLFNFETFSTHILPHTDMFFFDLKIFDSTAHKQHCGVPNGQILDNFTRLAALDGPFTLLPRTPLIPHITATRENITALADFLHDRGITRSSLLAYNPTWHDKCDRIGHEDPLSTDPAHATWMSPETIKELEDIYRERGIEV